MKLRLPFLTACVLSLALTVLTPAQTANDYFPKKPEKEPETAEEWYEYARWSSIQETNSPGKAMDAVNKAIELKPNLVNALYLRGVLKQYAGEYKSALEDFDAAIQFNPQVTTAYMMRAETRLRLDKNSLEGALRDYDLLIDQLAARNSRVYAAFTGRMLLRYQKGDLAGALSDANAALAMQVNNSEARIYRALIYLKQGNRSAALPDFASVAEVYQGITQSSREKYPQYYTEKKDYPYDQNPLASLRPKTTTAGGGVGFVVSTDQNNRRPFKIKTLKEKLSLDSWFDPLDRIPLILSNTTDVSALFYFFGEQLELDGQTAEAEKAYTEAIISDNSNFAAHFNRGKLLLQAGQFEPAVRDFSWTIHHEREFAPAYAERGLSLLLLNQDALAQKDFDICLKLAPEMKLALTKRIKESRQRRKTNN